MSSAREAAILEDAGAVLDRHVMIVAGMLEAAGVDRGLVVAVLSAAAYQLVDEMEADGSLVAARVLPTVGDPSGNVH